MKKITLTLSLLTIVYGFSHNSPINFEPGGFGADWTWTVFENGSNPELEIIANPDPSGINTSATVAKFTALESGNPWAGCETIQGDLGTFEWDETNSIIKIMVWKSVISDVGLKFDTGTPPNDWSSGEIKVANTLINQWEELTFDFSNAPNPPAEFGGLKRIIVFPDFDLDGRGQDNIIYFDNIVFGDGSLSTESNEIANNFVVYPNPSSSNWTIVNKTQSEFSVQLFDVTGKLILTQNNNTSSEIRLDGSALIAGMYFATITSQNNSNTVKLIKK